MVATPTAQAVKPITLHFAGSFTEVDHETCPFPITVEGTWSSRVQLFESADGDPIRAIDHFALRSTDTANGVSLREDANTTHTYDFATGLNRDLGVEVRLSLPHGAVVVIAAGQIVFDDEGDVSFHAGRRFETGDCSAYCSAFGG
jgi:hypothetical protein